MRAVLAVASLRVSGYISCVLAGMRTGAWLRHRGRCNSMVCARCISILKNGRLCVCWLLPLLLVRVCACVCVCGCCACVCVCVCVCVCLCLCVFVSVRIWIHIIRRLAGLSSRWPSLRSGQRREENLVCVCVCVCVVCVCVVCVCVRVCLLRLPTRATAGARFDMSDDGRLIIKHVTRTEYDAFLQSARHYFAHLSEVRVCVCLLPDVHATGASPRSVLLATCPRACWRKS